MSKPLYPNIPLWVQNRILNFFNAANSVAEILDGTIQDDPSDGKGHTIGQTLAARILRVRNQLPWRRFTSLEQIDGIPGVGKGTIKDLAFSLGVPADVAFRNKMYESQTIYQENWPLEHLSFEYVNKEKFDNIANDHKQLRHLLADSIRKIAKNRKVDETDQIAMQEEIKTGYLDRYHNSTPAAAYALALWFYEFDADNWFSWDTIQQRTIEYFDYHMGGSPWLMELYFLKGFTNRLSIPMGISPEDLPVVVNHAEQTVSFWWSTLYD
ncbi:MAG: hypothetical protein AAF544_05565 [Bacteroidota bacterium]